jgi:hypothetical protein
MGQGVQTRYSHPFLNYIITSSNLSSPPVKPLRFYAWGYKGGTTGGAMGEGQGEQKYSFLAFPFFSAILSLVSDKGTGGGIGMDALALL